ncbi:MULTISPECIES: YigZ family protein [unclassified Oceanobacillus]|uniref:YigZ family protein n=1 Tax=unclassified Oceanobacillus TaxID=2630292 RepID=UPI001BEB772D|nr:MULTISPECIES: YigZ family protein [unclassified Oceanobacillus]MBT2600141.1 YigZ family protein [Oceanobacillus sp. ISL-74]MBT2650299.1 YigZ family protein [Oceanobacillus sp. ISL-73]
MLNTYYTVKQQGMDEITIQKSRFIGYVKRVETEEEAQEFIQEIKKKHYNATHNCSAYMIGENDHIQKANDDGEPSGTAGVPILEVLKKKGLKDTAVVITRYFGGIKLGAGGLIRAYGSTTSQAIKTTGIVKRQLMQGISVKVEYTLLGKLENELRQSTEFILDDIRYLENVEFIVFVKQGEESQLLSWITDITNDQAIIELRDTKYMDIDVEDTAS